MAGCKKKETPAPPKTYLKRITSGNFSYDYFYDQQNRLQRIDYTDASVSQSMSIVNYDAAGNIVTYKTRTTGVSGVTIYTSTYDTQNRPVSVESRDSATNSTASVTSYSYAGNKTTRTVTAAGGSTISRAEFTYNAAGNMILEERFNGAGVKTSSSTFTAYDDKLSPETFNPHFLRNGIDYKNNPTAYTFTNQVSGASTNFSISYTYNSDNYPDQITYNGSTSPVVYNYTYEKR